MSGRNSQVSRLYTVYTLLENSRHGMTVQQILSAVNDRGHEVSWRTIYRDIEALQSAGFPLVHLNSGDHEDAAALWKAEATAASQKSIAATPRELLALYFSQELFASDLDHPFSEDLKKLIGKFTARMGASHLKHLEELRKTAYVRLAFKTGRELDSEVIETLQSACAEGHWVEAEYASSGKAKASRRIAPQFLFLAKEGLYLVGIDTKGIAKTYSLARFGSVKMLAENFTGPTISPEAHLGSTIGLFGANPGAVEEVELRFQAPYSQFIGERVWHKSQEILVDGDECTLRLKVVVTPDLVRWVLQYGPGVEVISPDSLRDRVAEALRAAYDQYETGKKAKKAA